MADGVWTAAGVADHVYGLPADRRDAGSDRRAAALPASDRWFVVGGGRLAGGVRVQAELLAAIDAHLDEHGYAVERFRDQDTAGRVLRATGDDVAVVLTVEGDGLALLEVYAGPGALTFAPLPAGRFVPA